MPVNLVLYVKNVLNWLYGLSVTLQQIKDIRKLTCSCIQLNPK